MKATLTTSLRLRKTIEVILIVIVIFLASLFFFSVGLKTVDVKTVIIALMITYIVIHYWERRIARGAAKQKKKENVPM